MANWCICRPNASENLALNAAPNEIHQTVPTMANSPYSNWLAGWLAGFPSQSYGPIVTLVFIYHAFQLNLFWAYVGLPPLT